MAETLFTSDGHAGHDLVARERGFASHVEHDRERKRLYLKAVRPDAIAHHLGDEAMGDWRAGLAELATWPGTRHLVAGNHDRLHPLNPNGHRFQDDFRGAFASVSLHSAHNHEGTRFMLSHFPYDGDSPGGAGDDRHQQWRLRDLGVPIVHGHTHSRQRVSLSEAGTLQINVSLDAWDMRPVHLGQILEIIRTHR